MNETGEKNEREAGMAPVKEEASACGPGCSCTAGQSGRTRWVLGAIIIVAAGVFVARAVMNSGPDPGQQPDAGQVLSQGAGSAAPAVPQAADAKQVQGPVVCGELIRSLGELDQKAQDKDGVFIFLAGADADKSRGAVSVIEKGVTSLQGGNIKVGLFTLERESSEFADLAKQVPPPGVIVLVKGRGMSSVSIDVTESKLMEAFIAASGAGST